MSDQIQFKVRLDPELKQLVDADNRTNKEVTHAALWREFGGQRRSALEIRIEHKEREEDMIKQQIDDLQNELAEVCAEKEALQDKLSEMSTEEEAYENALDDLLDDVESGNLRRLTPVLCEDVGETHSKTPKDVWEDARDRAAEQERDLLNTDFMTPAKAEKVGPGDTVPVSQWGETDE